MIAIINSGIGNLGSVGRAVVELGKEPMIIDDPDDLPDADRIILPGVGSFADGMAQLRARGFVDAIRHQVLQEGKPMLGICLGMHLLATRGTEGGVISGLDLIPGEVVRLDTLGCHQRIPHVGWNEIRFANGHNELFAGIPSGTDFYFVHSYAFATTQREYVLAESDYGIPFVAAVGRNHVWGTQFHPEKSSKAGFRLLHNFLDLTMC